MTAGTTRAQELADQIISLVRAKPIQGRSGDSAARIVYGAYLHGFRRLVAIRDLAGARAGAEAMILSRTLLSIVARAEYADRPKAPAERERRFWQYRARDLRDRIAHLRELQKEGFSVVGDIQELEAELDPIGDVGSFPTDAEILRDHIEFSPFYARLYQLSSNYVHFAQWIALNPLDEEEVVLEPGDPDVAEEALALAIFTFGLLLAVSEDAVGHGLHDRVHVLTKEYYPTT
jgi:hypothetical protein